MIPLNSSLDNVFKRLEDAQYSETLGQNIEAATAYYEAVCMMRQMVDGMTIVENETASKRQMLIEKMEFYQEHARKLMSIEVSPCDSSCATVNPEGFVMVQHEMAPYCNIDSTNSLQHRPTDCTHVEMKQQSALHQFTRYDGEMPLAHSSLWKLRNSARSRAINEVTDIVHGADMVLAKALDLDECGNATIDQVCAMYLEAAESFVKALSFVKEKQTKIACKSWDDIADSIKSRLERVLNRAEKLKQKQQTQQ